MKKIYLTFDIETIVSGISKSNNYLISVILGALHIANELKRRKLKATFFISLSSKQKSIESKIYLDRISMLLRALRSFDNIKVAPHIHAFDLPVSFNTVNDQYDHYSLDEQRELLNFARVFFKDNGYEVDTFRPGGFKINQSYYDSLSGAGYRYSSILDKSANPCFNMINGILEGNAPIATSCGVIEYPVTSVLVRSIKGREELVNLSPDFFTINSVKSIFDCFDYVNINYHSFSVYNNRLIRENHPGQFSNNLRYVLFEMPFVKLSSLLGFQLCKSKTILADNLIAWLDYIESSGFQTCYIGE